MAGAVRVMPVSAGAAAAAGPDPLGLVPLRRLLVVDPLPYLETQCLLHNARVALTDSGGLQKEAAFHGVPCVTLRDRTEWVELIDAGVNTLTGADEDLIVACATAATWPPSGLPTDLYGDGHTADHIARCIAGHPAHEPRGA